jgi:hypothetical protein
MALIAFALAGLAPVALQADILLPLPSSSTPSTAQAGARSTEISEGDLRSAIAELASDDPQEREGARQRLTSLTIDDLDTLKSAAQAEAPLSPEQIEAVRDAAMQTFMRMPAAADQPGVPRVPPSGKLGIYWNPGTEADCEEGVIVDERFTVESYRKLQPGDIIVSLPDQHFPLPLRLIQLQASVNQMQAGETARLRVLRNGQLIDVLVRLALVPPQLNEPGAVENWLEDCRRQFLRYWNTQFRGIDPGAVDEPANNP